MKKINKVSRVLISLALAVFFASTACAAGSVSSSWNRVVNKNDGKSVVVVFHTEGNVDAAAANITSLMKTRDPGGFMNPYWIVDIADSATNKNTKCGIIVGTWYRSGFPARGSWESIMRGTQNYSDLHSILYSTQGNGDGLSPIDSNADPLWKMCND